MTGGAELKMSPPGSHSCADNLEGSKQQRGSTSFKVDGVI